MKRNNRRYKRLTDRGCIPKENSSFSIDVKGAEKNRGMKRKRRGVKIGGDSMSMRSVVSKCWHQC
jgi:hypothetical protein